MKKSPRFDPLLPAAALRLLLLAVCFSLAPSLLFAQQHPGGGFEIDKMVRGKFKLRDASSGGHEYTVCVRNGKIASLKVKSLKSGKSARLRLVSRAGSTHPMCYTNQAILCGTTPWGETFCICSNYVWREPAN